MRKHSMHIPRRAQRQTPSDARSLRGGRQRFAANLTLVLVAALLLDALYLRSRPMMSERAFTLVAGSHFSN